jgi:hypothetical protein
VKSVEKSEGDKARHLGGDGAVEEALLRIDNDIMQPGKCRDDADRTFSCFGNL